jgi:CheY-like chemotaxis protein
MAAGDWVDLVAFRLTGRRAVSVAAMADALHSSRLVIKAEALAVDDRAESRQLLVRLLAPLGCEIREAANGEEAVNIWQEWMPHLILMDLRMPVMSGREATRYIKGTEKGKDTVIIALTASSFEEDREQILADGCKDFVRKPFREEVLFELMGKHLGLQFIDDEGSDNSVTGASSTLPDAAAMASSSRCITAGK